jgi:hypothetical protein
MIARLFHELFKISGAVFFHLKNETPARHSDMALE